MFVFAYLLFKYHVQHALRAVGFQQFYNMWMFQHVAYRGFPFQIWNIRNVDLTQQMVFTYIILYTVKI